MDGMDGAYKKVLETCPVCGKPTKLEVNLLGKTRTVPAACDCIVKAEKEREEEREETKRKQQADKNRKICFASCLPYAAYTFENDDDSSSLLSQKCYAYAETFNPEEPYGLLLMGGVGTGKTYMSSAIANRLLDKGYTALHVGMSDVVMLMESSFEKRAQNLQKILSYDLLCIDDLGAQRSTSYMMEHIYNVIDGRYRMGKPMIISTNLLNLDAFYSKMQEEMWERVFDRINEMCYPIVFDGQSKRLQKKLPMLDVMSKRLKKQVDERRQQTQDSDAELPWQEYAQNYSQESRLGKNY